MRDRRGNLRLAFFFFLLFLSPCLFYSLAPFRPFLPFLPSVLVAIAEPGLLIEYAKVHEITNYEFDSHEASEQFRGARRLTLNAL